MKKELTQGIKSEKIIIVESKHSANSYGSGLVDVFSTPSMIALMEQTCNELLLDYIDTIETSVGIEVCVKHLKATPIGDKVSCTAEVTEIYKNKITFKVEAFDSKGRIGEGIHKRAVIDKELFIKNLNH